MTFSPQSGRQHVNKRMVANRHFDTEHPSQRFALNDTVGQLGDLEGKEQLYF
jgi:hypothetical protein